jgi:hypothetical protein
VLKKLSYNVNFIYSNEAEIELAKCHSFLKLIFDQANIQNENLVNYDPEISIIQDELLKIQGIIEKKKNKWWNKVLKFVIKVIDAIGGFFGYGGLGKLLGYNDDRKLIE